MMNEILNELAINGIYATIEHNDKTKKCEYFIDGFYKSGMIKLVENNSKIEAHSRYGTITEIMCLRDLIRLNYDWWMYSKDVFEGWHKPNCFWLPLLLREGLVSPHVQNTHTQSSERSKYAI